MLLILGVKFRRDSLLVLLIILESIVALSCNASPSFLKEPKGYQAFSAEEKRDWIWEQGILKTKFNPEKLPPFEKISILRLAISSMNKKMDHHKDFIPRFWKKPIHRRSVVAKVRFEAENNSPYTGIFSESAIGLLRASLTYKPQERGVAPGFALKIFVDQKPSRDASFLTGLDSHGQNYNFFEKTFSNIIPPSNSLGAKVVSWIFSRASSKTNYISVKHLGEIESNSRIVPKEQALSPIQVFLKAPEEISFPKLPKRDIRKDLMKLKKGQVLLHVFARTHEKKSDFKVITKEKNKIFENKSIKIGSIVLESKFIASEFGDDYLFFRHQRFSDY